MDREENEAKALLPEAEVSFALFSRQTHPK